MVRFEPNDSEKLFGMGQYQQPYMDLKGCGIFRIGMQYAEKESKSRGTD